MLPLFPLYNHLLTILLNKDSYKTTEVAKIPELTDEEKIRLKNLLFWGNKAADRRYQSPSSTIDKLEKGESLNLLDYERIHWGLTCYPDKIQDEDQKKFKEINSIILETCKKIDKKISVKKQYEKLVKEQDIATVSLKIAKYSMIAAVAAAITSFITLFK